MSNCLNCGAALPPNSLVCPYCKTRHDVDLKGIHAYTATEPEPGRICPRCNISLQTIDLKIGQKFLVERCTDCLGLFFDPGELDALLEKTVTHVYEIDPNRLQELQKLKRHQDYPVTYIKCPVCKKLMNRINYGTQSGVILDKCRFHGTWLDGGELRQIMEWTKAGGQILHEKKQLEMERLKLQQERENLRYQAAGYSTGPHDSGIIVLTECTADREDWNGLGKISRVIAELFRSI